MDAYGNDVLPAILRLQKGNIFVGLRTVDATLAGEVLDEYGAADLGRGYIDEPVVFVDVATGCNGDECQGDIWYMA